MTTESMHPVQTLLRPGALARSIHWRLDKKMLLVASLLLAFVALVGWAYLTQQNQTAALNARIEVYRDDINRLNHLNADSEVRIAEAERLETVAARAKVLGFGPASDKVFVLVPDYPVASVVSWQTNPLDNAK